MSADEHLDSLADSIGDGVSVDWKKEVAGAETVGEGASVRAMRQIARIVDFNRTLQRSSWPQDEPATAPGVNAAIHPERWGDLTLLERVGAGATGEVWRAWDSRLQREVALKFLQPRDGGDDRGPTQLLDEARSIARVSHPGIVAVYGIAEHEGRAGMWMEFLRGPTLAQEIERRGAMPARKVTHIGLELCSALEALFQAGLLHRDIKPANVIVEPNRGAVLTDFGLGWRRGFTEEKAPGSAGTPIFMSPDLLAGEPATPQSDVYALGVTLRWALTGRSPFQARTLEELRAQAATGPSNSLLGERPGVPRKLAFAIERAMEPTASARLSSAGELSSLLRSALHEIDHVGPRRSRMKMAALTIGALIAVLIATVFLYRNGILERVIPSKPDGPPFIAVLPLVNLSGDPTQEYFADGMTDELIARLAQVNDLRVISRSSVMQFKGTKESLHEIAKKLHVTMVVEGSVTRDKDRVRISAELVDVASGRAVWAEVYERDLSDVFAIQSDVAQMVVRRVDARITPQERGRLERVATVNPEAHNAYLQGMAAYRLLTTEGLDRALSLFHRAAEIDTTFAAPWAGLAYTYQLAITTPLVSSPDLGHRKSLEAAKRALELDPDNSSALAVIASIQLYYNWDFKAAERSYREALELAPGDVDARCEFMIFLAATGRFDEAISESNRARSTEPLSLSVATFSLYPLLEGRRYRAAERAAKDLLASAPNSERVLHVLGQALLFSGKHKQAIATIKKQVVVDPTSPYAVALLGFAYGVDRRPAEARKMLKKLAQMNRSDGIDPYLFGIVHLGIGEKARALDYIEKSADSHSGEALWMGVDPTLDGLRGEPRFKALLKRLGLDKISLQVP